MRLVLRALAAGAPLLAAVPAAAATYTCGIGGAYPDLNACVAAARADDAVIANAEQRQDIVFQIAAGGIAATTTQTIAGWVAGRWHTTIQPVPGGGFRDYMRAHPNSALFFDSSYGGFLLQIANQTALDIDVDNVNIFGIQIEQAEGNGASGISLGPHVATATLDSLIVVWAGSKDSAPGLGSFDPDAVITVQNSLFVGVDPQDAMAMNIYGSVRSYDNTLVMRGPATINQGAGIFAQGPPHVGTSVIVNTAALGMGSCTGGVGGENNAYDFSPPNNTAAGSNNATCFGTFSHPGSFSRDGQTSAVLATEFVGPADYRLADTSVKLRGAGKSAANGITVDIIGNRRNTPDDIGAWAFTGGTPVPALKGATRYVVTAGTAWKVGPACTGANNRVEAIGGGAGGSADVSHVGGGGGEYAAQYGYPFTAASPGSSIAVSVGAGGHGAAAGAKAQGSDGGETRFADTWLVAAGGRANGAGGTGGIGLILHDGGDGHAAGGGGGNGGGGNGGGGAGGPVGDGQDGGGGNGGSSSAGGGGGGGDGGQPGATTTGHAGGNGGAGNSGTPGGTGQAGGGNAGGTGGASGGGGGGGAEIGYAIGGAGGEGGAGAGFDGRTGAGGGGGGGGTGYMTHAGGGNGGKYGAGGGAAGDQGQGRGGDGAPGILVVTCAPG